MILNSDNNSAAARAPPWGAFFLPIYHRIEVKAIAKKENIVSFSVQFPADKYEALVFHAEERGEKVEDYMADSLESWYRKKVPGRIREYLDTKYEKEFGKPPGPLNIPATEPEGSADNPSWEG